MSVVEGILLGYLPFEGLLEIQTHMAFELFSVDGEAKSIMREKPDCYVHMLNRLVLVYVERRKVVELRLAQRP